MYSQTLEDDFQPRSQMSPSPNAQGCVLAPTEIQTRAGHQPHLAFEDSFDPHGLASHSVSSETLVSSWKTLPQLSGTNTTRRPVEHDLEIGQAWRVDTVIDHREELHGRNPFPDDFFPPFSSPIWAARSGGLPTSSSCVDPRLSRCGGNLNIAFKRHLYLRDEPFAARENGREWQRTSLDLVHCEGFNVAS